VLDVGPDLSGKRQFFWGEGKGWPILKYTDYHPCAAVMWPFVKLL